ncbi:hypothetical protein [Amycolatopsis sp. NPDC059020]
MASNAVPIPRERRSSATSRPLISGQPGKLARTSGAAQPFQRISPSASGP